ncbi:MAG: hypothetical protein ACXVKP_19740 [Ilumatobacteraceae bacterium]
MTAPHVEPIMLLTYALDESREARELLLMSHAGLTGRSKRWRQRVGSIAGARDQFMAGLAAQYLGENLYRAREHWRSYVQCCADLGAHNDTDEMRLLVAELHEAGLDAVVSQLADDNVPRQRKQAAEHLSAVMNRMADCDRLIIATRIQLMLRRMRDDGPSS